MGRKTVMEERIDYYIMSFDLKPSQVLKLTKLLLEEYKEKRNLPGHTMPTMTEEEIIKQKQEMRRLFLKLMKKDIKKHKDEQAIFIYKAVRAPWLWDKILILLDKVADFGEQGPVYRKILRKSYFDKKTLTDEQLARLLHMSDDVLKYRKREAIKRFGYEIWDYAYRREHEDIIAGLVEKDTEEKSHPMRRETDFIKDDDDDNELYPRHK